MAALWLCVASLLVLLAMSCPGSEAISSQQLCGPHLVDALHPVNGDRGFLYIPRTGVLSPVASTAASVDDENKDASKHHMEMTVKRDIVEQCRHGPCSLFDRQNYRH